jgi:pyridoxine/pyridoxamine 5'-phosphate oxidase
MPRPSSLHVDAAGKTAARMVLIQYFDERGFVFFTNLEP